MSVPRIVFCSAAVGHGHTRAAMAIQSELRALRPDAESPLIDALDYAPGWFKRGYRDAYLRAIAKTPRLAGWLYDASDRPQGNGGLVTLWSVRGFGSSSRCRRSSGPR